MAIIDLSTVKTMEDATAAIQKLEGIVANSQREIGQWQRGEKKLDSTPAPTPTPRTNDPEYAQLKKDLAIRNMRDDKRDAEVKLREEYGDEVYDILSLEYEKFAKEQIRPEASSVKYFESCFELTYARQMKNKDSDLYSHYSTPTVEVKPPKTKDGETPPPVVAGGDTPPPPITNDDNPGATPVITGEKINNTQEAFNSLEKTLAGMSTNPYDN